MQSRWMSRSVRFHSRGSLRLLRCSCRSKRERCHQYNQRSAKLSLQVCDRAGPMHKRAVRTGVGRVGGRGRVYSAQATFLLCSPVACCRMRATYVLYFGCWVPRLYPPCGRALRFNGSLLIGLCLLHVAAVRARGVKQLQLKQSTCTACVRPGRLTRIS